MNTMILVGVLSTVVLFFLLIIFGNSFHPVKWIGKLMVRLCIGAFLLFMLNVIGESFSFHIPINLVTTAIGGLLGLPGLAALIVIKYTLNV